MQEQTNSESLGQVMRAPSITEERERLVPIIKDFRKSIDALIISVPNVHDYKTREVSKHVSTKLIEAKMWAGKMLESLGNPFPAELADKAEVR